MAEWIIVFLLVYMYIGKLRWERKLRQMREEALAEGYRTGYRHTMRLTAASAQGANLTEWPESIPRPVCPNCDEAHPQRLPTHDSGNCWQVSCSRCGTWIGEMRVLTDGRYQFTRPWTKEERDSI